MYNLRLLRKDKNPWNKYALQIGLQEICNYEIPIASKHYSQKVPSQYFIEKKKILIYVVEINTC